MFNLHVSLLLLDLFLLLGLGLIVLSQICVHYAVQPHPHVLVLAVHRLLHEVHRRQVQTAADHDYQGTRHDRLGVLLRYYRCHYLLGVGFALHGLLGVQQRVDEDVGQQETKLVCDDVVLLGGDELNHGLLPGLGYHHFDILLDDQHLVTILYHFISMPEDLLGQQVSQGHAAHIVDMDPFDQVEPPQLGEESIFILFVDQHLHVPRVDDVALKLFLVLRSLLGNHLLDLGLELSSYVVLLTDLYLKC